MSWKYKGKEYPDVISESERYNPKNRLKPFSTVTHLNNKMSKKEKRHAAAIIDTADEITPGTRKFLVDNKIFIKTGPKVTEDMVGGFGVARVGGYRSLPHLKDSMRGVIEQRNTKELGHTSFTNPTEDMLTMHHEVAHAKRDVHMTDKGLAPFDHEGDDWHVERTKKVSYDDEGNERVTHSANITPIAQHEIEADKYKKRMKKKLEREDVDVDKIYDQKFKEARE